MHRLVYDTINHSPYVTDAPPPLVDQIEAAAKAGFQGIGLDVWSIDHHRSQGGSLAELTDAIQRHALPCLELQAFVYTNDEKETAAAAENIATLAEVLRPEIIMSGTHCPVDDALVANLARFAPRVTETGARLAIEFLPTMPTNTIAKTCELIRRAGLSFEQVGVCLDVWHFSHGPDDWSDLDALAPEELAYVQFCDHPPLASNDLTHEMMQRRVAPGEGILDLDRFVAAVRAKGYAGPVGVEVISAPYRALGPAESARRIYEASARYWRA